MHFTIFLSAFVHVMCKIHISNHCSRKHGAGPTVNRAVSSVASVENPRACHPENPFWTVGFPGGSEVKASASNAGDLGSIPGLRRSPGEGNGNPLRYSCLENPVDGGAWWVTVHGVTKSRTWLSDFTFTLRGWSGCYSSLSAQGGRASMGTLEPWPARTPESRVLRGLSKSALGESWRWSGQESWHWTTESAVTDGAESEGEWITAFQRAFAIKSGQPDFSSLFWVSLPWGRLFLLHSGMFLQEDGNQGHRWTSKAFDFKMFEG